jgi:hypothetical protein
LYRSPSFSPARPLRLHSLYFTQNVKTVPQPPSSTPPPPPSTSPAQPLRRSPSTCACPLCPTPPAPDADPCTARVVLSVVGPASVPPDRHRPVRPGHAQRRPHHWRPGTGAARFAPASLAPGSEPVTTPDPSRPRRRGGDFFEFL